MITPEQFKAERIALQRPTCQVCHGTGLEDHNVFPVKVACRSCYDFASRCDMFNRGFFNPMYVAPRYWHAVYLSKLEPNEGSVLSLERQKKFINMVRDNQDEGYAIFGPPQTGKSTVTVGLYASVLWRELRTANISPGYKIPVRRLPVKSLIDQQQVYSASQLSFSLDNEPPEPEVSAAKIARVFQKQGTKYKLFLEEIDKVKETESRRAILFETLDMLHGCMGQLVITSNLTPKEFQAQMGGDMMHRITAMCKVVNLYE